MSLSFQLSSSSLTDGDELEMHCKGERGDEQQIEDEPIARVVPARGTRCKDISVAQALPASPFSPPLHILTFSQRKEWNSLTTGMLHWS